MGLRFVKYIWVVLGLLISGCGLKLGLDLQLSKSGKSIVVATTNYQTGALALLNLPSKKGNLNFSPIYQDAIVKLLPGLGDIFVINRLGADNLQRVDRISGLTIQQFSFGRGTNPQDIALVGNEIYVSCLNEKHLLKVQLETGLKTGRIDLSSYADADGYPEATYLRQLGNSLWVQLQKLDRDHSFYPTENSQVVILDTQSDQVQTALTLKAPNPVSRFKDLGNEYWLLAEAGHLGITSQLDGGVEKFDPVQKKSFGFITTEKQLGGDLVDVECFGPANCVAIISKPHTELVQFDPQTGMKVRTLWSSSGYHLRQVVTDVNEKHLYLVDANPESPQIRVWSWDSLQQRQDLNWLLKLPPYQMEIMDSFLNET